MRIRTPEISWFARKPIMSLDFQGKHGLSTEGEFRLATAAFPDDEKFIRIWRISFENNKAGAKIDITYLCSMGYHETAVNVVRFSPCDQLLAAGDSDGLLVIWKLQENNPDIPDIFEDDDEEDKPLEKWEPWKKLRRIHIPREDVVDLCWSTDGKWIVSCGIDHAVAVVDVEKGTKLALIMEHDSRHPMGLAWDPQAEFFVTLSNSRTMTVYDAKKFQRLHTVTKALVPSLTDPEKEIPSKIFHDDTLFSFSRRLCFSPCGELLFAPAGVIEEDANSINATYIFTRHQLTKPAIALTSAKERPLSVRCCPLLFELRKADTLDMFDLPYRIVFAVLTKGSVLFYDTQSCEPFAYVSQMQYGATLDMSWTPDGRCLVISAEEGYCTFIRFDENDLGVPMTIIPKPPSPPEPEQSFVAAPPSPPVVLPPPPPPPPPPSEPSVLQSQSPDANTIATWLIRRRT